MCSKNFSPFRLIFTLILPLQLAACGSDDNSAPQINEWPIAKDVFTTAEQQILPVALSPNTLHIHPGDVSLYEQYGYSAWQKGVPLPHEKRTKLAPGYTNAPNAARLLSFFAITDIHIADKESPAQPIYIGATTFKDTTSHAYNAELVKQLSPAMQAKIANYGLPIQ
ncbi:MAG: hypothetical protein ACOYMW_03600 [Candidatus Competibacteraceae bacterium]